MEQLIWQQVKDSKLEPVKSCDWAAPIAIVKKNDGGIRMCADLKMTVIPHLWPKACPFPTAIEVFALLAEGKCFSTIDLSGAYV